jgi:hypothetical protein
MAERPEEFNQNPPESLLSRPARRAALVSYIGPLIVLFLVVGFGLMYWSAHHVVSETQQNRPMYPHAIGTSGTQDDLQGGFDPQSETWARPRSTDNELERRGGVEDFGQGKGQVLRDTDPLTSISEVMRKPNYDSGRAVDLKNVTVDSAQGNRFWIHDGSNKVEVIAPEGAATPKAGAHVHVVGHVEDTGDSARIRASKIE